MEGEFLTCSHRRSDAGHRVYIMTIGDLMSCLYIWTNARATHHANLRNGHKTDRPAVSIKHHTYHAICPTDPLPATATQPH